MVMFGVVIDIRSVTLRCCNDAKASLADYDSLYIIIVLNPEKVPQAGKCSFFWYEHGITLALDAGIFPNVKNFFLLLKNFLALTLSISLANALMTASSQLVQHVPCQVTILTKTNSGAL